MNKNIIIGLACLVMLGCSENKVTEQMLVGSWSCVSNLTSAKWRNGVFEDYGEVKIEKGNINYLLEGGQLLWKTETDSHPFDLKTFYDKPKQLKIAHGGIRTVHKSIEYYSQNKFKMVNVFETIYPEDSLNNHRERIEFECLRRFNI
ncbi:hypothetical protein [Gilliamella sp. wkB171]|uniref:hypothetical protein n=1 Tax=Gilliamella sp. wkB171 TaxID=3120258 RepID=UPI000813B210|nr:hypothetical protein [Gilliamella apicola]OCL28738.1 hypothetical protein A9G03_01835 [Gilliamella apicola]